MIVSYAKINNITCNECQKRIGDCLKGLLAKKKSPSRAGRFFFFSTLAVGAGIHTSGGKNQASSCIERAMQSFSLPHRCVWVHGLVDHRERIEQTPCCSFSECRVCRMPPLVEHIGNLRGRDRLAIDHAPQVAGVEAQGDVVEEVGGGLLVGTRSTGGLAHELSNCGCAGSFQSEDLVKREASAAAFGVMQIVASQFKGTEERVDGANAIAVDGFKGSGRPVIG